MAAAGAVAGEDLAGVAGSAGTAGGTIAGVIVGVAVATAVGMMVAEGPGGRTPGAAIHGRGPAVVIRRVPAGTVQVRPPDVESVGVKGVSGLQSTTEIDRELRIRVFVQQIM